MQQDQDAGKYFNKALYLAENLSNENIIVKNNSIADIYLNKGLLYSCGTEKDFGKTENLYEKAIYIQKELAQKEPKAFEIKLARSYTLLGALFLKIKEYVKAEDAYKQAMNIYHRLYQDTIKEPERLIVFGSELANVYDNLGTLIKQMEIDRTDEAKDLYTKGIMVWEEIIENTTNETTVLTYQNLLHFTIDFNEIITYEQGFDNLIKHICEYEDIYKEAKNVRKLLLQREDAETVSFDFEDSYYKLYEKIKVRPMDESYNYKNEIDESMLRLGFVTNDTVVLNRLANQLLDGEGRFIRCEENDKIAFILFKRASDAGNLTARHNLGWMYKNGRGCEVNYEVARKLFEEAGKPNSFAYLGEMYEKGLGVPVDYVYALKNYKKGADEGSKKAQKRLENIQGYDEESLYKLGMCYYYGKEGFKRHYGESVKWYQLAAVQGHAAAQCALACCYEDGTGVKASVDEAIKWFRLASDQGYAEAQYKIGMYYYNGMAKEQGLAKNLDEAVIYFQKAAKQGLQKADIMLNKINKMSFMEKLKWKLS